MLDCEPIEVWRVPRVSMLDLFTDRKRWSSRRKHTLSLRMRARSERVKLASSLCDLQVKTCSWLYHFATTYVGVVYCCRSSSCLCWWDWPPRSGRNDDKFNNWLCLLTWGKWWKVVFIHGILSWFCCGDLRIRNRYCKVVNLCINLIFRCAIMRYNYPWNTLDDSDSTNLKCNTY